MGVLCALLPATTLGAYAPVGQAGPPLAVPNSALAGALACSPHLDGAARTPVLLVHGTSATREENWSSAYIPALTSLGIPWCAVQLPARATGDIQTSAEYVVHAIREMHRRAGRRISIIGASQGGTLPRWALRWWPDTRPMIDDVVALAATNHGTTQARLTCRRGCVPAFWQQMDGSAYTRALNSIQETFAGISYTNVYTRFDEVVRPPESAELHTGNGRITNVEIQDICPLDPSEHLALSVGDPVAFAVAMDALRNDGPAGVARVAVRGCVQPGIPGFDPVGAALGGVSFLAGRGTVANVKAEPALRCYVTGTCVRGTARRARLTVTVSPRRVRLGKTTRLRVSVRVRRAGRLRPVAGATIRVAGRRARTNRRGRATLRLRFGRPGRRLVTARRPGSAPGRTAVRVLRR